MAEQTQQIEQPATESIDTPDFDARMEALFGDGPAKPEQPEGGQEPADEAGAGEVPEEPEAVEVEFNGTKYQVPPELKDALMAQADYTSKTTEVANTRRTLDLQAKEVALFQEQRAFEQSVAQDFDQLKMLDAYIAHEGKQLGQNWQQMTRDARQDKQFELDRLEKDRNALAQALQGKRDEFASKIKGERNKLAESAKEVLSKAIPNWGDESRASVHKYMQSMGYPVDPLPNMSPLDYQLAWKAMQYDKIKAETKTAVKKAADAPVIAPTARKSPMPKRVRTSLDLKNAVKTGDKAKIEAAKEARLSQLFGG